MTDEPITPAAPDPDAAEAPAAGTEPDGEPSAEPMPPGMEHGVRV